MIWFCFCLAEKSGLRLFDQSQSVRVLLLKIHSVSNSSSRGTRSLTEITEQRLKYHDSLRKKSFGK